MKSRRDLNKFIITTLSLVNNKAVSIAEMQKLTGSQLPDLCNSLGILNKYNYIDLIPKDNVLYIKGTEEGFYRLHLSNLI